MAYAPLSLDPNTPPRVQRFVRKRVDSLLSDVHAMLRLPHDADGLQAGCSMPAAMTLLSMIGGMSRVFHFPPELDRNPWVGRDRRRFVDFVQQRLFPLDPPTGNIGQAEAAEILYREFRNYLVHALAEELDLEAQTNRVVFRRALTNEPKVLKSKDGLSETQIAELECGVRPTDMKPTFEMRGDGTVALHIPSLYVGLRKSIERLSSDQDLMRQANALLDQVPE